MRVPEEKRKTILHDVGGDADDAALVCHVIETLYQGRSIDYGVSVTGEGGEREIVVRVGKAFDIFTSAHSRKLHALSRRIRNADVVFGKLRVHVFISAQGDAPAQHKPGIGKRQRITEIDWTGSRVTDADDLLLMNAIVEDVYHMSARMPDTQFYFEPILTGGIATWRDTGMTIPLTSEIGGGGSEDASESSIAASRAPESARCGYAMCFVDMPTMSTAFFRHLHDQYGSRVASAYAWMGADLAAPMLVVNIRRATTPAAVAVQTVTNHLPKQLVVTDAAPTPKKRVKRGK